MTQSVKILLLLVVLVSAAPVHAKAQTSRQSSVIVAVDAAYWPYMYGTTQAAGIYPEIIRAVFEKFSIPVEVTGFPWKRALTLGRIGKAAVGGIYQNLDRLTVFDYSDPLFTETLVVCVKKGHAFPFRGMVDLKEKRVGINRGWSYGEVFDTARRAGLFIAEEAADNRANLKKLLAGRVDCIIADELSLLRILKQQERSDQVEMLSPPAAVNSTYLVFAKHTHQVHLLELFNQGLIKIKEEGRYNRIIDAFIHEAEPD